MLELEVILSVVCCHCERNLGVTLKCDGEGLADKTAKAKVLVPCPHCHESNHIIFTPDDGEILDVMPVLEVVHYLIPKPSLN